MSEKRRIEIPRKYGLDALDRGLDIGDFIAMNRMAVVLDATDAQIDEIVSDASHYATPGQFSREYSGLVSSARACLRWLNA